MAEKSRTLKLSILADIDNLTKGLSTASKNTQSFSDNVSNIAKKATIAFGAAAAAIGAFATASIKNALEDEAAQRKLAETLRVSTGATQEQTQAVEAWISKTSVAIGVSDDQLRPSLARLARSTNDITEAQDLLNLSLDIAAATGKPLETVANALGKAYDGNAASLGRLGLGLDATILKSKDTDLIFNTLKSTFGTFAENEAETTAKKFERIKIATDEAKEAIGAALLPIVEQLATFILETVVPNMNAFIDGLTGAKNKSGEATKGAYEFGEMVKKVFKTVWDFKELLIATGAVIGSIFLATKIAAGVQATIAVIKSIIVAYNALKASAIVAGIASAFALNPLLGVAAVAVGAAVLAGAAALARNSDTSTDFGGGAIGNYQMSTGTMLYSSGTKTSSISSFTNSPTNGSTGTKTTTTSSTQSAFDKLQSDVELLNALLDQATGTNQYSTTLTQAEAIRRAELATPTTYNITVNGALDSEATARQIVQILEDSAASGGAGTFVTSSWDK